jgi:L-histidine Nalpha-methyltransferase
VKHSPPGFGPNVHAAKRVHFLLQDMRDPLADDGPNVIRDLSREPKRISCVYVYDRTGTELFERQCQTPEYYLRRAESALLQAHAGDMLSRCGYPPLVELGAGTAQKTRILLTHYASRGLRCDYYPIDVDVETLAEAAQALTRDYLRLEVHCLGGRYEEALPALPASPQSRLFLFLGSSLGNMPLREMEQLLELMFAHSTTGDYLLVGADLHKDAAIIDRAYNDAEGVGARSTLNMLEHLNWRYGGDFRLEHFAYRSKYDAAAHCNRVHIESLKAQSVQLRTLRHRIDFAAAERIEAELMWKFTPPELVDLFARAGFTAVQEWIEPLYGYGIFLFRRQ